MNVIKNQMCYLLEQTLLNMMEEKKRFALISLEYVTHIYYTIQKQSQCKYYD